MEQRVHPTVDTGLGPLAPPVTVLPIGGGDLQLQPADLLTLSRMLQAGGEVLARLESVPSDASMADVLLAMVRDPEAVGRLLDVAALGAGKPRSWVDALRGDEQLQLIVAVIEVNHDFFAQRLRPILGAGMSRLMKRLLGGRT